MSEPRKGDPVGRFFAGAVIAVGALVAALCGSCTLWWVGMSVGAEMRPNPSGYEAGMGWLIAVFALVIGAGPTVVGVILVRAGLKRWRGAKPEGNGGADG